MVATVEGAAGYIGIDVAKDWLDVAQSPHDRGVRVPNSDAGILALVAELTAAAPALVVLEASGGYETAVTAAPTSLPFRASSSCSASVIGRRSFISLKR